MENKTSTEELADALRLMIDEVSAPILAEISDKWDGMEQRLTNRFTQISDNIDDRFTELDRNFQQGLEHNTEQLIQLIEEVNYSTDK